MLHTFPYQFMFLLQTYAEHNQKQQFQFKPLQIDIELKGGNRDSFLLFPRINPEQY